MHYVMSDIHGNKEAFDTVLSMINLQPEDHLYILGDVIDRGEHGIELLQRIRNMQNCTLLMGNHEDMMLEFFHRPYDRVMSFQWGFNGGHTTQKGLSKLSESELIDTINWVENLPLGDHVEVGDRSYILVHAGLNPLTFSSRSRWTDITMDNLLHYQNREDLLWIRDEFWGWPHLFVDEDGKGPIVIAGHTPVPYVEDILNLGDTEVTADQGPRNENGECQIMHLGACKATGGIADRWAIDCGAAGGHDFRGRIGMVRLDDGEEFYESIREGE